MASFACRSRKHLLCCLVVAVGFMSWINPLPASAQIGSARYSSIVVDAASGEVLEEVNADEPRHPASLTKMMTLYLAFEALRDRRISLDETVPVSFHAAEMQPSKLGLMPSSRITVEQAMAARQQPHRSVNPMVWLLMLQVTSIFPTGATSASAGSALPE